MTRPKGGLRKNDPYVRNVLFQPGARQEQPPASKALQKSQILDDDDGARAQPSEGSAIAHGKGIATYRPYSGPVLPPGWVPEWSMTRHEYYFANREGESKCTTFDFNEVRMAPPPAQYIAQHSLPMAPKGWKWIWSSSQGKYYCFHSKEKSTFDHGTVREILLDQNRGIHTFFVHVGSRKMIACAHLRTNVHVQILKID